MLLGLNSASGVPADLIGLFSDGSHTNPANGEVYRYRLYEPQTLSENESKFPLIVWMHGYGERGDDNIAHLEWLDELIFDAPRARDRFPFYLLAVQCPRRQPVWFQRSSSPDNRQRDMVEMTHAVIQNLITGRSIDPDRVYVAGLSSGGTACWEIAFRYPETFAAVMPAASAGLYADDLDRLARIPIWAFHSRDDEDTPIRHVRNTVQRLLEAGGNVRLTEIPSKDHDCWNSAFRDHHALDWLLAQRRGKASRAGRMPVHWQVGYALEYWTWWQLATQAIVVLVPVVLVVNLTRLYRS